MIGAARARVDGGAPVFVSERNYICAGETHRQLRQAWIRA
jgi:hypothetical protein